MGEISKTYFRPNKLNNFFLYTTRAIVRHFDLPTPYKQITKINKNMPKYKLIPIEKRSDLSKQPFNLKFYNEKRA